MESLVTKIQNVGVPFNDMQKICYRGMFIDRKACPRVLMSVMLLMTSGGEKSTYPERIFPDRQRGITLRYPRPTLTCRPGWLSV